MEWYREVQFVAAVPMPVEWAREYGTTVNGMWDSPARWSRSDVDQAHRENRRVLVSVPLIALTAREYEKPENRYLLEGVCRDINGDRAEVKWYYWDPKPVYSMCLYGRPFRDYLLTKIRGAVDAGADVLNVDEINTSIGLMSREPGGSGFCPICLEKFCSHLDANPAERQSLAVGDAGALRADHYAPLLERLRKDDHFYRAYRSFHERAAFAAASEFLKEIRSAIASAGSQMAVTANLAGLGTFLGTQGSLWGAMWSELLDFVMMENVYLLRPGAFEEGNAHWLLPRGKFVAWYRLASSFSSQAPAWLCPQINVPRQLAGKRSVNYYLLMFLESYSNNGRWGYYWWPGVDERTRLEATVPEAVKDYTRFITAHRRYYEDLSTENAVLVLYANSAMLHDRDGHFKYLGLGQALAESGFQYDVRYLGDDLFTPGDLPVETLRRYRAVLLPEAGRLTAGQTAALREYSDQGGRVVPYSGNPLEGDRAVATMSDSRLLDFWFHYRPEDREHIIEPIRDLQDARVSVSDPTVGVVRYRKGDEHILHVLNYDYRERDDSIAPKSDVDISLAWSGPKPPSVRWMTLQGEESLDCRVDGGSLTFTIPKLDPYGLAVIT